MDTLLQDLRYALRLLAKSPGFTLVAVVTLALGIGANTATFSVIDAVLLKALPFPEPERLVMVWERNYIRHRDRNVVGPANFIRWREQAQSFEGLSALAPWAMNISGGNGEPERVPVGVVTGDLFRTLGVQAATGRALVAEDSREGAENVIVLSHGLWQRRFGGEAGVVGKTLVVNGESARIVGVMPANFEVPPRVQLWLPLTVREQAYRDARGRWMAVVARLKPGVTLAQAQAEMDVIGKRAEKELPDFNAGWGVSVIPLREQLVGDMRTALLVLLGAVGCVLLIACANVASVLLARALTRERELAIRVALGAGRGRLVRQLLTESLLLAVVGGLAGLAVARGVLDGLLAIVPLELPRLVAIEINPMVLGFTLGVSLLTAILFGLVPALEVSSPQLSESLKEGGRGAGTAPRRSHLRQLLVVAEVALALVLLVGAGLLLKSFHRLQGVEPGFEPDHVLSLQINLSGQRYAEPPQQALFYQEVLERLERLPGVVAAGAISWLPLGGPGSATSFVVADRPEPAAGEKPVAEIRVVTPGLFRALEIPLKRGRTFTPQDSAEVPKVAVVNETLAKQFWPDENPVGKRLRVAWGGGVAAEIVGVVADVRLVSLETTPRATIYWTQAQLPNSFMAVMVRSKSEPTVLARNVRSVVASVDPEQPVANIRALTDVVSDSLRRPRFSLILLGSFAGLAMVLAMIGIYGVIAYSVTQRTREIGIRLALGAKPGDIFRLVIGQGLRLALAGVALGLAGALVATRVLASLLFQVTPTDPATFAAVALALVAVAVAACYVPARRATRVEPMTALRYE